MAQTPTCPSGQYPAMSGGCAPPSSTSICSGGTLTGTNLTVTPACGAVGALATIQHIHVYAGDCAFYDSVSGYHYVLHCSDGSSMSFATAATTGYLGVDDRTHSEDEHADYCVSGGMFFFTQAYAGATPNTGENPCSAVNGPVYAPPSISNTLGGTNSNVNPTTCQRKLVANANDPVDCATGDFYNTYTDLSVPGRGIPLSFSRTYNSLSTNQDSPFGYGWTDSYKLLPLHRYQRHHHRDRRQRQQRDLQPRWIRQLPGAERGVSHAC